MTLAQIWESLEGENRVQSRGWRESYAAKLLVTDVAAIAAGAFAPILFGVGSGDTAAALARGLISLGEVPANAVFAGTLSLVWLLVLAVLQARDFRVIGEGSAEYKLILNSAWAMLGLVAVSALALQLVFSRPYVISALILVTVLLICSRGLWRIWLRSERRHGRHSSRVVVVGSMESAEVIARDLVRRSEAGYHVVGACVADETSARRLKVSGVPVLGGVHEVSEQMARVGADTVLMTDGHNLSPQEIRAMSWSLQPGRQHLVMAPSLTDIAGPRIHTRPVAGLPLIHVETPKYSGFARFLKRAFDTAVSAALLLVLSPVFLFCAIAIKVASPGPIFYGQQRVGKWGNTFTMLKFRSMVVNADAQLAGLLEDQGSNSTPLFKIKSDPRITPIGRIMRRYSIDELPQLVNVFVGQMALVGPRPQVAGEVELYDSAAARRLIVKPGMTGLWQVSGRSSLSWEESVRLDLYYIENWTFSGDLLILWKTFRAVVDPGDDAH